MSKKFSYGGTQYSTHFYTINEEGIYWYHTNERYDLDGIEGYIYERCPIEQEPGCIPPGAEKLYRRYKTVTNGTDTTYDYVLFPESSSAAYTTYTGTSGLDWIGYAYPNLDTDHDGLINGFERLIGSCVGVSDTNGDGHLDGTFVSEYPYRDLGLCNYISVSPSPLLTYHFGSVAIDYPTSVAFTVFHGGSVMQEPDLAIGTITVNDTDNFTVVAANDACSNQILTAGETCSFTVEFHPASTGTNNAALSIPSNDPFEPLISISVDRTGVTPPQLTVNKSGGGTGTIWSAPGAINCGSTCSGPFAYNALVSLTETPNIGGSIFTGWSGDCDGNGQVTMGANKTCAATFTSCSGGPTVKVGTSTYALIWDAYNNTLPGTFDLEIMASNQQETLNFNKASAVTLKGGRNCAFGQQTPPAVTFITGSLTITDGSVIFDGIAIR